MARPQPGQATVTASPPAFALSSGAGLLGGGSSDPRTVLSHAAGVAGLTGLGTSNRWPHLGQATFVSAAWPGAWRTHWQAGHWKWIMGGGLHRANLPAQYWTVRGLHYPPRASECPARRNWPYTPISPPDVLLLNEERRRRLLYEVRARNGLPPTGAKELTRPAPTMPPGNFSGFGLV
jgi:hypothetical protein